MNIPVISYSFVWLVHTVLRQEHRFHLHILCSDVCHLVQKSNYIHFLLLENINISLADVSSNTAIIPFCLTYIL